MVPPSGVVFQVMVHPAEVGEVSGAGFAVVVPVEGVVEVALLSSSVAAGVPAGLVPVFQVPSHVRGDGVAVSADGEHGSGFRVGEDPVP